MRKLRPAPGPRLSIYAGYDTTYTATAPYISVGDYMRAPTGVSVADLVSGGGGADQIEMLAELIDQASSQADAICLQVLGATGDIDTGPLRARHDGTYAVTTRYWPLLELRSFSLGQPGVLPAAMNLAGASIMRNSFVIRGRSLGYGSGPGGGPLSFGGGGRPGVEMIGEWSYVAGWPVTALAITTHPGDAGITVGDTNGIYPGTRLHIRDGASSESVVVSSLAGPVLTLVSPLISAHVVPGAPDSILVSALPPDVTQAVIRLTSALIKSRSADALVLESVMAEPTKMSGSAGGDADVAAATALLVPRYSALATAG